jgi:hypothetical protein
MRLVKVVAGCFSLLALTAYADAIQSWRTPSGTLYFGDRPPAGSTLITTYADSPRESSIDTPSTVSDLSREAAEGRAIMRRRDEERMAERQREFEEDQREQAAYVEPAYWEQPYWIVGTSVPCTAGVDCVDHIHDHRDHIDHHHHDDHARGPHSWPRPGNPGAQTRTGGAVMQPAPAPPVRVAPPARMGGGVSSFRR